MCFGSGDVDAQPSRAQRQRRENNRRQNIPMQNMSISGPVTPPGQVPALERDNNGLWVQYEQTKLNRQNILAALGYVGQYLHRRGENVTLVAVGGAVNTVVLQSRATTHDVDFFSHIFAQPHLDILREAGLYAIERSSAALSRDWLNNATARMPGVVENIDHLIQTAVAQNVVLMRAPGLTVVAAPWDYSFIKKVSRITQGTGRPYDGADAVAYLHQYIIRTNGNRPITVAQVEGWGKRPARPSRTGPSRGGPGRRR
ncbi:hypothetical protein BGW36DRAFT_401834 [Talaromyces proteolyticus]|uniref:DUF7582 domain-containing protein n=1 Tax=Talaromyces proteolyticus TaxID=1131652 RepID=A0AAD4PUK0_9EURO|nr:uncharacterized protein BGW36DRAFT_401834 [Talaromyces proteolyticus]KAH8689477.1 hypothetical protein BGW36DRAFT_401834 [Talaromyces proteolyticus]